MTPPSPHDLDSLLARREEIQAEILALGDFRQGSLVPRYRRCGKPNCRCAKPGQPGHGPSYSLTRTVQGSTVTRIIPAEAVETTRRQLDEFQRFRQCCKKLVEVNENICQASLALKNTATTEKKTSPKPSRRPSPGRSGA